MIPYDFACGRLENHHHANKLSNSLFNAELTCNSIGYMGWGLSNFNYLLLQIKTMDC